jgi:hypothetical protein
MFPDRVFYPLAALAAALIVGLALNWPQGEGVPTPSPLRAVHAAP